MVLSRAFWTVDTAIGQLPAPLANLAGAAVITLFVFTYTWLATVDWAHPNHKEQ